MKIQFYPVHPLLTPYVAHIWSVESPGYKANDIRTIIPNGRMKMVFPYRGSLFNGPVGQVLAKNQTNSLWLLGTSNRPSVVDADGPFGVLSMEFHPGGAYRFIKLPLSELTNRVELMSGIFGALGHELQVRLIEAPAVSDKVKILQNFLLTFLQEDFYADPIVDYAIRLIQKRMGWISISEISERLGYSQRYVALKFDRFVGLNPKTLTEIVRFQNRFALLNLFGANKEAQDIEAGYYDQSQFIKEFKRFTGFSPLAYTKSNNEFLNLFQQLTSDFYYKK